jgi:DNA-binding transcriptional ArsR family regulator
MHATPNLAAIGQILGDPTRTLMLELLYDGRAWTASELARATGVTPPTASSHLAKLVDANLIAVEPSGRHRYYRIADAEVAEALEGLLVLALRRKLRPGIREVQDDPLRHARTCYDHIAGRFAIDLIDSLLAQSHLEEAGDGYLLSASGEDLMAKLNIDVQALRHGRRPLTRRCLDWSERRYHLGGALGAALASSFIERKWIRRIDDSRALTITVQGKRQFRRLGLYNSD